MVGVRIDVLVRIIVVGSTLTVRMKGLRHEWLSGHVQCMYRVRGLPIGVVLVTQAGLLENLHRPDTMTVEEVAKKGRDIIRPRFGGRRAGRVGGGALASRGARIGATERVPAVVVATEMVPAVVVATKLAGARVLDKSERQRLVFVEVIQDLVVRVTKRALFRSLEGS
jgi:hypothetical protein